MVNVCVWSKNCGSTYMRYRQAKYEPRPERKNCMAEMKLKQQIWIGIHKSGPILLMSEYIGRFDGND